MTSDIYDFKYTTSIEGSTKTINLKWTIYDFKRFLMTKDSNRTLAIGTCDANYDKDTDSELRFKLLLKVLGTSNDFLEIYFVPSAPVYVRCFLYTRQNGLRSALASTNFTWLTRTDQWFLVSALLRQNISTLLSNDSLAFEFHFFVRSRPIDEDQFEVVRVTNLNKDLETLLTTSMLSDVTIKSLEGVELPAHKNILAVRSAVFKAHFEHGTQESLTNVIESPFEAEVLREVLLFIYSDKVSKLNEMVHKLLKAADFYQLDKLKVVCEGLMLKRLTVENAIETLELAERYSVTNLKKHTLKYINDGRLGDIIKTKGYKEMQSVENVKSILEFKYQ